MSSDESFYPSICLIIYMSISAPVKSSTLEGSPQSFTLLSVRCLSLHVLPASIYLSIYPYTCIHMNSGESFYPSICLIIYMSISAPVKIVNAGGDAIAVPLRVAPPKLPRRACLSIHPSIYLGIYLSIYPSINIWMRSCDRL